MKKNRTNIKNLLNEKSNLDIQFEKLKTEMGELNNIKKNLINHKISTIPMQAQIIQKENEISVILDKKNRILDKINSIKKQELRQKLNKIEEPLIKKPVEIIILENKLPKQSHISIPWHNIKFLKGFIRIKYKNVFKDFTFPKSVVHFQKINSLYENDNLKTPEIYFIDNEIKTIVNPEIINLFIEVLEMQSYYEADIQDYQLLFNKVIKQSFTSNRPHYKIYKKSDYLNHLFDVHDTIKKILYIPEYIINNNKIIDKHESYLFPLKKKNFYFFIWESVNFEKATYIFRSSETNIETDRIKLFEYLGSRKMKNKRDELIHSSTKKKEYHLYSRISHDSYNLESWMTHLERSLNRVIN